MDEELRLKLQGFQDGVEAFQNALYKKGGKYERVEPPLKALCDMAQLVHAHVTKIGIAFKPPVSVKAAGQCVDDCAKVVPLMLAVYLGMDKDKDGDLLCMETRARLQALMSALSAMLIELLRVDTSPDTEESKSADSTLTSIGMVWQTCDHLKSLPTEGLQGVASTKLQEFSGMIQDSLQDIKEWIEDPSSNDFDFDDFDDDDDGQGESEGAGEPDEELVNLAKKWQDRLVKVDFLYKSIIKRRLKLLQDDDIEKVYACANDLSAKFDDLIGSIMERIDIQEINDLGKETEDSVRKLVDLVVLREQEDQFVKWIDLFNANFYK